MTAAELARLAPLTMAMAMAMAVTVMMIPRTTMDECGDLQGIRRPPVATLFPRKKLIMSVPIENDENRFIVPTVVGRSIPAERVPPGSNARRSGTRLRTFAVKNRRGTGSVFKTKTTAEKSPGADRIDRSLN